MYLLLWLVTTQTKEVLWTQTNEVIWQNTNRREVIFVELRKTAKIPNFIKMSPPIIMIVIWIALLCRLLLTKIVEFVVPNIPFFVIFHALTINNSIESSSKWPVNIIYLFHRPTTGWIVKMMMMINDWTQSPHIARKLSYHLHYYPFIICLDNIA